MKIGILQTGYAPEPIAAATGEYPQMFADLLGRETFDYQSWAVCDGVFPDGPEAADGWLITGSRHGAYDPLPWITPLEQLIRDIVAAGRPLVGVCFGHQIIAQALGGRVEKFPGGWLVGPQAYDFGGETVTLQAWHQDQVMDLPEGAEVVASGPNCRFAALHYPGRAYTVQAHPEYGDAFVKGLIEHRGRGVVPDDQLAAAQARMGGRLDRERLAATFTRFFETGQPS